MGNPHQGTKLQGLEQDLFVLLSFGRSFKVRASNDEQYAKLKRKQEYNVSCEVHFCRFLSFDCFFLFCRLRGAIVSLLPFHAASAQARFVSKLSFGSRISLFWFKGQRYAHSQFCSGSAGLNAVLRVVPKCPSKVSQSVSHPGFLKF